MFAYTPYAHLHISVSPWDGNEYRPGDRSIWTMTNPRPRLKLTAEIGDTNARALPRLAVRRLAQQLPPLSSHSLARSATSRRANSSSHCPATASTFGARFRWATNVDDLAGSMSPVRQRKNPPASYCRRIHLPNQPNSSSLSKSTPEPFQIAAARKSNAAIHRSSKFIPDQVPEQISLQLDDTMIGSLNKSKYHPEHRERLTLQEAGKSRGQNMAQVARLSESFRLGGAVLKPVWTRWRSF